MGTWVAERDRRLTLKFERRLEQNLIVELSPVLWETEGSPSPSLVELKSDGVEPIMTFSPSAPWRSLATVVAVPGAVIVESEVAPVIFDAALFAAREHQTAERAMLIRHEVAYLLQRLRPRN